MGSKNMMGFDYFLSICWFNSLLSGKNIFSNLFDRKMELFSLNFVQYEIMDWAFKNSSTSVWFLNWIWTKKNYLLNFFNVIMLMGFVSTIWYKVKKYPPSLLPLLLSATAWAKVSLSPRYSFSPLHTFYVSWTECGIFHLWCNWCTPDV